jgi:hypothetical protein
MNCLIALLMITTLASASNVHYINGDHYYGCTTKEKFDELLGYITDNDMNAFTQAFDEGLIEGTVVAFKNREPVYVEDAPFLSGMVELRRSGETQTYWTVSEAIKGS